MASSRTTQFVRLFHRERRRGDLVFAVVFLVFSAFMFASMGSQTIWAEGTALYAQPRFWPAVSLAGMTFFATLHWIGSALSPRLPGRWQEIWLWARSVEYAAWFLGYVLLVPFLGYLIATLLAGAALMIRVGYRSFAAIGGMILTNFIIVLTFKSTLKVNLPGGAIYEYLPTAWRSFMLTYF
ncbi:tripartite tricarboxylate transporter TctB family protein [Yoonia sp. R2331]|uniref:tripartite tricarboxylate transporter TctB family protein n=1 Tax=Yoonia sp. R2331 TaxID=3237238 RepID=UPI0034E592F2